MTPAWQQREIPGDELVRADWRIRPVARMSCVTWPGGRLEWRRPAVVEIRRGARVRRVPIVDATRRRLVWLAMADALLGAWAIVLGCTHTRRFKA